LLITGPTGVGKSYLSSALEQVACRKDNRREAVDRRPYRERVVAVSATKAD